VCLSPGLDAGVFGCKAAQKPTPEQGIEFPFDIEHGTLHGNFFCVILQNWPLDAARKARAGTARRKGTAPKGKGSETTTQNARKKQTMDLKTNRAVVVRVGC